MARSGVVGTDVTMAAEALHYDVINMKQSPYGKDVDPVNPVSPNCALLQIDIVGGNPVQNEVPLPLTSCDNDPGVCGRNNMIGPCSTNKTHPTYSSDCKCPLGSIRSTQHGCLKCPSNFSTMSQVQHRANHVLYGRHLPAPPRALHQKKLAVQFLEFRLILFLLRC